ncbi:MAG: D-cysteine desulfhydrase family protein [Candidatus Cloacimonadota bacterium]|nr:MAG: D-cysteine desulfhydrase family protein [Candidatus Cloacimonadota bacterium]
MLKPMKLTIPTLIGEIGKLGSTANIFIKRDDLNGLLISGNKARKLEYLVADAKRKRCDTLITCGGVQSNHCRITAVFAKQYGFDCHLMLRIYGKPKKIYTANLLISKLLNATIHYITPSQYDNRNEVMKQHAKKLQKKGRKPYVIPEGGSNEIGILGYRDCMMEMAGFIKRKKIEAVYCAVGSGGTYAGLLLGKKLLNVHTDLNGILVSNSVQYFQEIINTICNKAIKKFRFPISIDTSCMNLIDGFIGPGYGIPYPAELKTIKRVAQSGIILDPVYTGKTFHGMLDDVKKKKYKKVLFIHTGGIFSIFAYAKELTNTINT